MKYELTKISKEVTIPNTDTKVTVYQIKALKEFTLTNDKVIKRGDLGGWVQSADNLSQEGRCWIYDECMMLENARRSENSIGYGNSIQYGHSEQYGNSVQYGNSQQYEYSEQYENSQQYGNSCQFWNSRQYGNSKQYENSCQFGNSQQHENSQQLGDSWQYGYSKHYNGIDTGGECVTMGPFGEQHRMITVQPNGDIAAECFTGTLEEFTKAVVEKYGEDYGGTPGYALGVPLIIAASELRKNISLID